MNKKIKDILIIIGLVVSTIGAIAGFDIRTNVAYTIQSLNLIIYGLCLIIIGTSRET